MDADRLGRYLPKSNKAASSPYPNAVVSPVLACPSDEDATRSYAMNLWASCAVRVGNQVGPAVFPRFARTWSSHAKRASKLLLVVEAVSYFPEAKGRYQSASIIPAGNMSDANHPFYPGVLFIGTQYGVDHPLNAGLRYVPSDTQLDWSRHARRGDGAKQPGYKRGRANFGFADGHVESFSADDLAHRSTQRSKFVALWSPLDYVAERQPRPNF